MRAHSILQETALCQHLYKTFPGISGFDYPFAQPDDGDILQKLLITNEPIILLIKSNLSIPRFSPDSKLRRNWTSHECGSTFDVRGAGQNKEQESTTIR